MSEHFAPTPLALAAPELLAALKRARTVVERAFTTNADLFPEDGQAGILREHLILNEIDAILAKVNA